MHRNNNAPQKLFQLNVQHNGRTRSLLELVKSRLIDQNLTLDHYFSLMIIMGKCLQAWPDVLICHLSHTQWDQNVSKNVFKIPCLKYFTKSLFFSIFSDFSKYCLFQGGSKLICYFTKSFALMWPGLRNF